MEKYSETDEQLRSFFESVPENERSRFRHYMQAQCARLDNLYFQYRRGYVDEEFWSRNYAYIEQHARAWKIEGVSYGHPDFISRFDLRDAMSGTKVLPSG